MGAESRFSRRRAIAALGAGGALTALGYALRSVFDWPPMGYGFAQDGNDGMMGMSRGDMGIYMEMFRRHNEIDRVVEEIPGGVRTTTQSNSPELAEQLKAHVSSMYSHVGDGAEVMCMSSTLPTLFRRADGYRRQLTFTATGVIAEETSDDPELVQVIRDHAREVTGFVQEGMPAMMSEMMGQGMMGGMMGPGGMMDPP